MGLKHLDWYSRITFAAMPRPTIALSVAIASIALHGIILGLPWPLDEPEESQEPATATAGETAAMEVAILPNDRLQPTQAEEPAVRADTNASNGRRPTPATEEFRRSPPPAEPEPRPTPAAAQPIPPSSPTTPEPAPVSPSSPSEDDMDPLGDIPIDPGTRSLSGDDNAQLSLEDQLKQAELYRYSDGGILDDGEVLTQLSNWTVPGQPLPSRAETPIQVPYLLGDRCLDPAPTQGILGVVLDVNGTPLRGPSMISSTGYDLLDRQAIEMVQTQTYQFPEREQSKAYSVQVRVSYPTSCP